MRILLVDDHPLFLAGMRHFMEVNGFTVVGTAGNGVEAQLQYEMLRPDLVLMDLQMAGGDGIEATRMIKKEDPAARIVMLTAIEDDASLFGAIRAGAEGYLLKEMEPENFIRQLNDLQAGEVPLAPGLAKRLMQEFSQSPTNHQAAEELTPRQLELLQLLGDGMTYKEIANHLEVKEATVKYHVREILGKLRLTNRAQLIAYASQRDLMPSKSERES